MLLRTSALVLALSTAAAAAAPDEALLVIDATADPGIHVAATFVPAKPVPEGVRRIAALQTVTASAVILLDQSLPVKWFVSVSRRGEIAPNQITHPYEPKSDGEQRFRFSDDLTVIYRAGQWILPAYDLGRYDVEVGIGLGAEVVFPAYTVRCRPNETIAMAPGGYQWVQIDGRHIGDAIAVDQDGWAVPMGGRTSLTVDEAGQAALRPIP